MREVAEVIGVRQSRASQIHSMVLLKLKASWGILSVRTFLPSRLGARNQDYKRGRDSVEHQ